MFFITEIFQIFSSKIGTLGQNYAANLFQLVERNHSIISLVDKKITRKFWHTAKASITEMGVQKLLTSVFCNVLKHFVMFCKVL